MKKKWMCRAWVTQQLPVVYEAMRPLLPTGSAGFQAPFRFARLRLYPEYHKWGVLHMDAGWI